MLGTAVYMSPEQARGETVDGRSDVFSFGVVLYKTLTGRAPFTGGTTVETLAKILEAQPPPLASLRKGVPAAMVQLVSACLEKDRNRRPSAREIHRQLPGSAGRERRISVGLGALLRRPAC